MTKIKICGITTLPDARLAIDAGAELLGFNFYSKSVRCIDTQTCEQITSVLKKESPSVQLVGVFVNASLAEIRHIFQSCHLDLMQLHGDESPEYCASLGGRAFKAFRGIPEEDLQAYIFRSEPEFLVDASVGGAYGGTGRAADWSAASKLTGDHRFLLAGGLNSDNVAEALQRVKPWGVDVASGVEGSPGRKDARKVNNFVQAVRSVQVDSSV